jgi:hypothetical protein
MTSGAAAKVLFKDAIPAQWHVLIQWLVIAGVATVLLMGRFLFLAWNKQVTPSGASGQDGFTRATYVVMLLIIAAMPAMFMPWFNALSGAMPVVIGVVIVAVVWRIAPNISRKLQFDVPPGDVLIILNGLFAQARKLSKHFSFRFAFEITRWRRFITRMMIQLEKYSSWSLEIMLRHWQLTGTLWLGLCLGLIAVLI